MKRIRRGGAVRVLVTLSALSAIGIILGKFLAFNITEFMRFSLENLTIIFSGIVFGPLLGAAVGAVQDLVGCLAVGYTINPIITLGSMAIGAISGGIFAITKRLSPSVRILLCALSAHLIGSVLIKSIGLAIFYSLPFTVTVLWRMLNYAIVGAIEVLLLNFILKSKQMCTQINKIVPFSLYCKFKSQDEAMEYAKSVSGVFSKPGLERISMLLEGLGHPERDLKVVHVAGTNGKGSFVTLLSSLAKECGAKVGSFTSPYLEEMRESIRIDTEPISEDTFLSLFERLRPIAESYDDKPTEFELLTAAAFLAFKEANVDIAIVECGMGGSRDATNVIEQPILSVITGISLDHTDYLGESKEEIAKEKAGIIKNSCPVLFGPIYGTPAKVIRDKARSVGVDAVTVPECKIKSMSVDGTVITLPDIGDVRVSLLGYHQGQNAYLAYEALKMISAHLPRKYTAEDVRSGFAKAVWQGRFEILLDEPTFVFDGAHNPEGISNAVSSAQHLLGLNLIILTGVLKDKDYYHMADTMSAVADAVVTITPNSKRALPKEEYAKIFTELGVDTYTSDSVDEGVALALKLAKERDLPVLCLGSLYIYGEVKEAVKRISKSL